MTLYEALDQHLIKYGISLDTVKGIEIVKGSSIRLEMYDGNRITIKSDPVALRLVKEYSLDKPHQKELMRRIWALQIVQGLEAPYHELVRELDKHSIRELREKLKDLESKYGGGETNIRSYVEYLFFKKFPNISTDLIKKIIEEHGVFDSIHLVNSPETVNDIVELEALKNEEKLKEIREEFGLNEKKMDRARIFREKIRLDMAEEALY
jgi:hypothetical protein